jgi:hypothetical protein
MKRKPLPKGVLRQLAELRQYSRNRIKTIVFEHGILQRSIFRAAGLKTHRNLSPAKRRKIELKLYGHKRTKR